MRPLILTFLLAVGCGDAHPRDPASPRDGGIADSGSNTDAGANTDAGSGGCDLGLPSHGMVIERGSGGDHLLELARGNTRVAIARYYVEPGVGESYIFRIGGFSIERDGVDLCVTDPAKLAYENSHHNWRDAAELTEGSVRYRIELSYEFIDEARWHYELYGFDAASGTMLFGPEPLELVGGPIWP